MGWIMTIISHREVGYYYTITILILYYYRKVGYYYTIIIDWGDDQAESRSKPVTRDARADEEDAI